MANNGSGQSNQLKHGAIGGIALVFLVIAAAAPLGASATNTPLIFMLGNGPAATFDFLIIGALLLLFSVGFTAMSTHITNAGAFYAYISVGLGKKFGTGPGSLPWPLTTCCRCIWCRPAARSPRPSSSRSLA